MSFFVDPFLWIAELGGPVLVILLILAAFVVAFCLYKSIQYRHLRSPANAMLSQIIAAIDDGDVDHARYLLKTSPYYLKEVFLSGLVKNEDKKGKDRLQAEADHVFRPFEKGLRTLELISQIAPLLGLLGTVLGMIEAFQSLQEAGRQVDPSILAGGIWVALLTTAAGLVVAIPASIAVTLFESRLEEERLYAGRILTAIAKPH